MASLAKVALIGLGEVGSIFAAELKTLGVEKLAAFDPLFSDPSSQPSRSVRELGIEAASSAPEAARGACLVISAVTAAQALGAVQGAIPGLDQGVFVLDLNSASPGVKAEAARQVDAAGARYVEAAVMSSVPGKGLKTPMLLGGPHAGAFLEFAGPLGLKAEVFATEVGPASATKMCRSVMIKGVEALLAECLVSARRYGVEDRVLGSLGDLLPNPDWERHARYMISRSLIHGRRRAEEMREVARTVSDVGVDPWMSSATAERQDWAADIGRGLSEDILEEAELEALLDAIIAAILEGSKARAS